MRLHDLTYQEALERHPRETQEIVEQLRRSKSKERSAAPETLGWRYECCLIVPVDVHIPEDFKEFVTDRVSRTRTSIQANLRRWRSSLPISNPPEVAELAAKEWSIRANERARWERVSPEERLNQLKDALSGLPNIWWIQLPK